jgi:hypothetical protein
MRKFLVVAMGASALSITGGVASAASFLHATPDGTNVAAYRPAAVDTRALQTVALAAPTLSLAATVASSPHTTLGGATANPDGSVVLDSTKAPSAGISFTIPGGLSVGDVTDFSTDYDFGSSCVSGVPQLVISTLRGDIYVSLGAAANFNCSSGLRNSSSFLHSGTPVDTGRIPSGTFTDTWCHAKSQFDRLGVTGIQLVTTAANQSVVVSNSQLILNPRSTEEPSL